MNKTVVIVGAGMMGSAMSVPARDNGHEVRIVGTHLDRAIIDHARQHDYHITMKRGLPAGITYYPIEELERALQGADLLIGGVSSFGVDWFGSMCCPSSPIPCPFCRSPRGCKT